MPEWLIWVLAFAALIAVFLILGGGQITTSTRRRTPYSDRYDPVYLQQQEAQQNEQTCRKE